MADTNNLIDIEALSHFKAKQDIENAKKFKSKEEASDLKGAVRYDTAQVLTEQEKAQARANLGVDLPSGSGETVAGAVRYDVEQALSDEEKARARENIGTTDGTWENMPDKPFGKTGYRYEWNGDTTDKESVGVVEGVTFYRVYSDVLTEEELLGASFEFYFDGDLQGDEVTREGRTTIVKTGNGNLLVMFLGELPAVMIVNTVGPDTFGEYSFNLTSEGIWFLHSVGEDEYTHYIQKNYEVKKIGKEFLPDDINVELPEGLVTTDENGLIPASMLPSYVDDVVEGYFNEGDNSFYEEAEHTNAITGESGKIYVDLGTGNTYRWSGTTYVRINPDEYTIATNADIDALFT